tara:strand:- start:325 stop:681 length:357 start_codon:yes stop_codon:yes gene_type:complete
MDYRKLFRDALEAEANELKTLHDNKIIKKTTKQPVNVAINDIIDIDGTHYLVLYGYGKFHKLLNLDGGYEQLINLDIKQYNILMPNMLKKELLEYEKPEVNLDKYYRNGYLSFKKNLY